jgi:hypothetical protein
MKLEVPPGNATVSLVTDSDFSPAAEIRNFALIVA